MSTDRDTTRVVRSWLRTEMHASRDRVLDAVIDGLDTTPQRRTSWWPARRVTDMSQMLRFGAVAAVVSMAMLIGYAILSGPARVGPEPMPSPTDSSLHPLPDAFDSQTITLSSGQAETSLDVELPADGSLVSGPPEFGWRFSASAGEPVAYFGTWGLVIADVTDATSHSSRFASQDPIPAGDGAAFLASLAGLGGYEISGQREIEVAGQLAVMADVGVITSEEPAPSGASESYPHLDVNGEGGISFGQPSRVYIVEIGGRLILIQVWSSGDEGLEVHRQLEDRIIGSIRESAVDNP